MGAAAKPRWAVVFLMIFTLGVSLGLPVKDVLDAVYDESEALPSEGTSSFSSMTSPVAATDLTGEIFCSLKEAQILTERWGVEYNTERPLRTNVEQVVTLTLRLVQNISQVSERDEL